MCKDLDIRNISPVFQKVSLYKKQFQVVDTVQVLFTLKGTLYVRTWI